MKSILLIILSFIYSSTQCQIENQLDIDYRVTGNHKMHFKSSDFSKGNFQLKMVPSDTITEFKLSIANHVKSEYSISFNKRTLKNYNNYSCILPEGDYKFILEAKNEEFSIDICQIISFPTNNSRSQCGNTDDRVLSNDPKSGRKRIGGFCTAQLLSNGLLAMSGHCVTDTNGNYSLPNNALVEFNVPLSDNFGNWTPSLPQDQYPINIASIQWEDYNSNSCGREWTLFQVNDNAITGLSPFQAQSDFYYLTNSNPLTSQNIQIVGYGADSDTPNRNLTQQSHNGPNNGVETLPNGGIIIKYETDTEGGNSGSAIQRMGNLQFSYGIHNNGGCDNGACTTEQENSGISFQYDNLEDAINYYYGNNTIHVSKVSNSGIEDGSAFRPYDTMVEGQTNSTANSTNTIILMTGTYNEVDNLILNKPMLLKSPSGQSIIK